MAVNTYGKTSAERDAEESAIAREIVREITSTVQVSQRQLLLIIHGLAMNLEKTEELLQITGVVRSLRGDLFLIDRSGDGGSDGTSNG
jgi:adenylosuccinate lyase